MIIETATKIDFPPPLLVLAGGQGTRLKSIISDVPKPLAPVTNKSLLYYQLKNWLSQGFNEIVLLIHHKADKIQTFLNEEKKLGTFSKMKITCIVEPIPLGTGGAIANAIKQLKLNSSFLVTNADTWIRSGMKSVYQERAPAILTVNVKDSSRYGKIETSGKMITSFQEKTGISSPGLINGGVYHLMPLHFAANCIKEISLEKNILPNLIIKKQLRSVEVDTNFIDIGIPKDYRVFCNWIKNNKVGSL